MFRSRPLAMRVALGNGLVLLVLGTFAAPLRADLLVLESGGRIQGEWLNPNESDRSVYIIRTADGARLEVAKNQVQRLVRQDDAQQRYEQFAPTVPDTVEDQWQLVQWCGQHGLKHEREKHLRRIIELDPNHRGARSLLGHHFVDGQWITREEFRRKNGLVLFRGKWRYPHEVQLIEEREQLEAKHDAWRQQLVLWRRQMETPRFLEIAEQITKINDPYALPAIWEQLRREPMRVIRMLYVESLRQIGTREAVEILVYLSLNDPDEEVYYASLEAIQQFNGPEVVKAYIKALGDENNLRINRAAYALGQLNAKEALEPLIDVLVTSHRIVIPVSPYSSQTTTYGLASVQRGDEMLSSPTAFQAGHEPLVLYRQIANAKVLEALVKLTDASFGYDERAWKEWLAIERRVAAEAAPARLGRD